MKKLLVSAIATIAFGIAFAATDPKTIVIAASEIPHADILKLIQPDLEKEGFKLEIKYISDYATPNVLLESGDIDFNYFQHVPYLNEFVKNRNYTDLKVIGQVHVEPISAYSLVYKSVKEIKNGDSIAIPNDPSNEGRAYKLLEAQGLIKLKKRTDNLYTEKDVVSNSKKIKFITSEAAAIPALLKAKSVSFAIINGNIAHENNLIEYRFFSESGINNPYANIIVARNNTDSAKVKALLKYINTKKVYDYITTKYTDGSVIPAFKKPAK